MVDFPVPAREFTFNYSVFSVMRLIPDIEYQSEGRFGKIALYQHLVLKMLETICYRYALPCVNGTEREFLHLEPSISLNPFFS